MNIESSVVMQNYETLRIPKTIEQLLSKVMKRYCDFVKDHNMAQKPELGRSTHLRTTHLKGIEVILYKYLPVFRGTVNSPIWADSDRVPALTITRRELANLMGCKMRNTYNVLARLAKTGIITIQEVSEAGYNIEPNLWLITGLEDFRPEIVVFEDASDTIALSGVRQSLPVINNNETLSNSFKAESVDLHGGRHTGIDKGKGEKETLDLIIQEKSLVYEASEEENFGAAEIEGVEKFEPINLQEVANNRVQNKRDKFFGKTATSQQPVQTRIVLDTISKEEKRNLLSQFWKYAEAELYSGTNYKGEQLEEIYRVIYTDVFGHFHGHGDYLYWKSFVLQRMAEVDMMVKHNAKFERKPFTPKHYFSRKYVKRAGFLSAYQWTKRERRKHKDFKAEELLTKAKMSLVATGVPRGMKYKITTLQQLVEYWAKRLSQATNSQVVREYYHFVSVTNLKSICNI